MNQLSAINCFLLLLAPLVITVIPFSVTRSQPVITVMTATWLQSTFRNVFSFFQLLLQVSAFRNSNYGTPRICECERIAGDTVAVKQHEIETTCSEVADRLRLADGVRCVRTFSECLKCLQKPW